ncbi:MAG: DNA recombination protein RmuC [Pseudomonadota bacterium]
MSVDVLLWVVLIAVVVLAVIVFAQHHRSQTLVRQLPDLLSAQQTAEQSLRHREMLTDLADGLAKQGDRLAQSQAEAGERLRTAVAQELTLTRESVTKLQLDQAQNLATLTQNLSQKQDALKSEMLAQTLEKIAEQSRVQTEAMQSTMRLLTLQISERVEQLTKTNDTRLAEISGKVTERLDEGFKKTNETFVNVMTRLATIDEAQKKLDGLTTNVVSLQQLLGDKKSRGAFGEVQLEQVIRNMLPETSFEFQYAFTHGDKKVIADCVLKLPDPVGLIAIDSKFPLENYERMISDDADKVSPAVFKADVKKHVDAISSKYIIAGVTSDGAMMFVPAEAVFAEIHARHRDVVEYAQQRRVWIVSPTTLMAVLNTVRAVLKDVETRKQVHIIKDELGKLGKEFGRFDERMRKLAEHIRQANDDAKDVSITSKKISDRFQSIERVELDATAPQDSVVPNLLDAENIPSLPDL